MIADLVARAWEVMPSIYRPGYWIDTEADRGREERDVPGREVAQAELHVDQCLRSSHHGLVREQRLEGLAQLRGRDVRDMNDGARVGGAEDLVAVLDVVVALDWSGPGDLVVEVRLIEIGPGASRPLEDLGGHLADDVRGDDPSRGIQDANGLVDHRGVFGGTLTLDGTGDIGDLFVAGEEGYGWESYPPQGPWKYFFICRPTLSDKEEAGGPF